MKIFYAWRELVERKAREAAGINSPHNACMFRADCRKADAEIARLRERLEVTHAYVAGKRIEVLAGSIPDGIACRDETIKMQDAEIARLREAALAAQNAAPQSPADLASVPSSQEGAGQVVAGAAPITAIDAARKEKKKNEN